MQQSLENRIGKWNYLAFYLLSGIFASLAHWGSDPMSTVPTLGASGAIAGVLGGYLLFWYNATISGFYVLPAPAYVHTKAYWFLIGWFVMQFSGVLSSVGPIDGAGLGEFIDFDKMVRFGDGIAYWAHIGGFIAGFIMAGLAKILIPKTDVCMIPKPECDTPTDTK